jgi:hypothetical protein
LGAAGWRPIKDDYYGAELPDVTLRFVYPNQPALQLQNISGKVALQIRYTITLWNLDATDNPKNPLQIPVGAFDFIKPGLFGGPLNIFQPVATSLKSGNRLFGSASVSCPDCARGRTFWVYIVWDQGGWYSEIPEVTTGAVMIPKELENSTMTEFADRTIPFIPESRRIPIEKLFQ